MKVVFVDFDGVLNHFPPGEVVLTQAYLDNPLEVALVARLEQLVQRTAARVVISSSWRARMTLDELRRALAARGFTGDVIDTTPRLRTGIRAHEISAWLALHPEVAAFAILDDEPDAALDGRLVRTDPEHGFTDADLAQAILLLGP